MGLLDRILGGTSGSQTGGSAATSPAVKALLLLLAAKAASSYLHPSTSQAGNPQPDARQPGADGAGSQGTISSGMLRGLPSLQGLGALVERFTQSGHGDKVQSWMGSGKNQPITPDELHNAIGPDLLDQLQQQTGMPREQLLNELSRDLPQAIDQATPQGRLPTEQEVAQD